MKRKKMKFKRFIANEPYVYNKEMHDNIEKMVMEEMEKNGYKRDKDPLIIELRKLCRQYGIEPKF